MKQQDIDRLIELAAEYSDLKAAMGDIETFDKQRFIMHPETLRHLDKQELEQLRQATKISMEKRMDELREEIKQFTGQP